MIPLNFMDTDLTRGVDGKRKEIRRKSNFCSPEIIKPTITDVKTGRVWGVCWAANPRDWVQCSGKSDN